MRPQQKPSVMLCFLGEVKNFLNNSCTCSALVGTLLPCSTLLNYGCQCGIKSLRLRVFVQSMRLTSCFQSIFRTLAYMHTHMSRYRVF